MSDSAADKLNTPKFKELRDKPEKYLKELSELAVKHGLELTIKQIKRSDIVVSRNKGQKYEKLFDDTLKLLAKKFPSKYKQIKQFKYESMLLKQIYLHIFMQIPKIENKKLLAKEKAGFLIFLENYLIVNRHLEISTSDRVKSYLVQPEIKTNKAEKEDFYQLMVYSDYSEEQTREVRDILLYFNTLKSEPIDDIEFLDFEINEFRKYIPFINDFWYFNHIYELWAYLDMPVYMKNNTFNTALENQKTYKSWMISNYRSRHTFDWRMHKYSHQIENSSIRSITDKLDAKNINHIMCLEYFFAFPSDISINSVTIDIWLIAYENLINYAKVFIENLSNKKSNILLKDWLSVNAEDTWVEIISGGKISKEDAITIFSAWVLNSDTKRDRGDIFDHPFYKLNGNQYLLFSSVASQLAPIQCLLSLAKHENEIILIKNNHFENEVEAGLQKSQLKFVKNINIEKVDGIINQSNRKGEFDFIFEIDNTLFFIECKRFIQPFYFKDYQILYEKIHDGCNKLKKNVNHVIKKQYKFDRTNPAITDLLSDDWINKKKIIKVLLTSCCLGEYLFLHDCHVLDIEVFNAWLFNKEIVWRDTQTMKKIHVSSAKKQGSLLDRFELLPREIDILKHKREQCTMVTNTPIIGGMQAEFPMYLQCKSDQVVV